MLLCAHLKNHNLLGAMHGYVDNWIELQLIQEEFKMGYNQDYADSKPPANTLGQVPTARNPRDKHFERCQNLFQECLSLMERKNRGYTGLSDDPFSNFRQEKFDQFLRNTIPTSYDLDSVKQGILTRFGDKVQRIQNIMYSGEVNFDSLEDTLKDGINYLAILYSYLLSQQEAGAKQIETRRI